MIAEWLATYMDYLILFFSGIQRDGNYYYFYLTYVETWDMAHVDGKRHIENQAQVFCH